MESFDENKVLAENVCLKSADNHLYRIGLCFSPYNSNEWSKRRNALHNPILISSIFVIQIIKSIVNLLVSDPKAFVWNGDFTRVFHLRIHFNIAFILFSVMTLSSTTIWYSNYKSGVEPTFLRLFQMISGSVPPLRLGLRDSKEVLAIIRRTEVFMKFADFNCQKLFISFALILMLGTYLLEATLIETLVFGIPYAIHLAFVAYYGFSIMLYQGFYFDIICYYLRLRLRKINRSLVTIKTSTSSSLSMGSTLRQIDLIYKQIIDYNQFLSKYLLQFWLLLSSLTLFFLYISIFAKTNPFFSIILTYAFILFMSYLLFVILNASSVNSEANKSHKILNSIYVSFYSNKSQMKGKRMPLRCLLMKLKVRFFNNLVFYH